MSGCLASPQSWYRLLPAAVPDFGPLNEHFVRDIGCLFCVMGAGLVWAAAARRVRVAGIGFALAFNGLHAMLHVYDPPVDACLQSTGWSTSCRSTVRSRPVPS